MEAGQRGERKESGQTDITVANRIYVDVKNDFKKKFSVGCEKSFSIYPKLLQVSRHLNCV